MASPGVSEVVVMQDRTLEHRELLVLVCWIEDLEGEQSFNVRTRIRD